MNYGLEERDIQSVRNIMNEYNKKLFLLDEPVSRGHATFHGGILFEDEYQSILEIFGSVADNSC